MFSWPGGYKGCWTVTAYGAVIAAAVVGIFAWGRSRRSTYPVRACRFLSGSAISCLAHRTCVTTSKGRAKLR